MKYIVSAGGTAGHIYPALAIIDFIKESDSKADILYIGTHNRMEKDIVPKKNIEYKELEMYGLKRSISFKNIKVAAKFIKSIKAARKIIRDFKPDIVIGTGGYVTAPVIYAAKKEGIKTIIHEQNSELGLTNKYLSKYADKIFVSFEKMVDLFPKNKAIFTGNPCSESIKVRKPGDKKALGLSENKKLVLIVMGSLGSKRMNETITAMLPLFNNKDYEVLYVTGKEYYSDKLSFAGNIHVVDFYDNSLLKRVDVMVSRAGATTMSEIISLKIPSILVPSPYVTNNHQLKNATYLKSSGACIIIEEKDLVGDVLVREVDRLIGTKKYYSDIKKSLENFESPRCSEIIIDEINSLLGRKI